MGWTAVEHLIQVLGFPIFTSLWLMKLVNDMRKDHQRLTIAVEKISETLEEPAQHKQLTAAPTQAVASP